MEYSVPVLRLSRTLGAVGLCCLWLAGCAGAVRQAPLAYVVQPQDTVYSIAWRHNVDYRDLARWNHLGENFRISIGQVLRLDAGEQSPALSRPGAGRELSSSAAPRPGGGEPPAPRPSAAVEQSPPLRPSAGVEPSTAPRGIAEPSSLPRPAAGGDLPLPRSDAGRGWVWPTDRKGVVRAMPGGGIVLPGQLGQEVRAASGGRVVYTGNGLRGYGNLIILKHADSLLSAYAFNREVLVREGEDVAAGEVIAHMGVGSQQGPGLYFEIRQDGKAVDPRRLLPR